MGGNVYLNGAKPSRFNEHAVVAEAFDPRIHLVTKPDGLYLQMGTDRRWMDAQPHKLVTSPLLGRTVIPDLPYELRYGLPLRIDTDDVGKMRNRLAPVPGPFENTGMGELDLKVW